MTRIIFISTFFTIYLANAQVNEFTETELQEKADNYIYEYSERTIDADSTELREKAFESYSLLVKNFPKSEKYSFYLYTKGCLAFSSEESKKCFAEVIQINNWEYYVRQSYLKLSWFAIHEKDFNTALKYLDLIGKMGKPSFQCGTEMEIYYNQLKNIRKLSEIGLKK